MFIGIFVAIIQAATAISTTDFVFQTPEYITYQYPPLIALWQAMLGISTALLVIVISWNGIQLMIRRSAWDFADAVETFPKILFSFLAACFSLHFVQMNIDLENAFSRDFQVGLVLTIANNFINNPNPALVLTASVYAIMFFLLIAQAVMRLAWLSVLTVLAPIAMLCWAIKETEVIAKYWLSSFLAVVYVQFLQVLTIFIGLQFLYPVIAKTGFVGLLAGIGTLYLTLKLPGYLQQAALHSIHDAGREVTSAVTSTVSTAIGAVLLVARA